MSKKMFYLIACIVTCVEAISVAIVSSIASSAMVAINTAIPLVGNCAIAMCQFFVKKE